MPQYFFILIKTKRKAPPHKGTPTAKRKRSPPIERPPVSAGVPTVSQFERLRATVEELKGLIERKKGDREASEGDETPEIFTAGMSYQEKYDVVQSILPVKNNATFKAILEDDDGKNCVLWSLQLTLNKAVAEEGASYDTSSPSSALASKVLHTLFSIDYVKKYKVYDPRENYVQQAGTVMDDAIYDWMLDALNLISDEFYRNFKMDNKFDWGEFYSKFRDVWRWTKSNNSDNRRARRRKKKN